MASAHVPPPPLPDASAAGPAPLLAPPAPQRPPADWRGRVRQWLSRRTLLQHSFALLISLAVHAAVLVAMSLLLLAVRRREPLLLTAGVAEEIVELEAPLVIESLAIDEGELDEPDESPQLARAEQAPDIPAPWARPQASARSTIIQELTAVDLLAKSPAATGGGLEGRRQEAKARLLAARGGTEQSENAVRLGLQWLAAHQRDSGSWRLNHQAGPCNGRCRHPGSFGTSTGATALALLPFLGAGHSSSHGEHREVVRRGIYYLQSRMLETARGGDLQEGTMYAQGLAAIALCENYALSGDESLRESAQSAVDFICHAQHPKGGWRYAPGQPGDTTVSGWQVMALKSAKMAGLRVPSPVLEGARRYLDSVESAGGAAYGYLRPGKEPSPTAVGLLLRMYLGWPQDDERLARGVDYLAARGPSPTDIYFNYYATQVLHHHAGPQWKSWNAELREMLIRRQARQGHERGSWYFVDKHNEAGGRLYTTAMSVMILEVYYRHMPLYGQRAVE